MAYHGAARNTNEAKAKEIIKNIVENGLEPGKNQAKSNNKNDNPKSLEEYLNVGYGVYLSNKIDTAESYAGKIKDENNNEYKIVFMCRVCPEKVRYTNSQPDYYVLDPNNFCIRPYRILLKEVRAHSSFCHIY